MGREGSLGSPEAKPGGVSEIGNIRGSGGRRIENAGAWQMVLQPEARHTLFRALDLAAGRGGPERIGHGVGFVEGDHAVEILARPGKDLIEPRVFGAPRAQRRIGDEEYAFGHRYGAAEFPAGERLEIERQPAKRFPISASVFEQRLILGDPHMTPLARKPAVHDNRCDLPALARSGPVAQEETLAVGASVLGQLQDRAFLAGLEPARQIACECLGSVDQRLALRLGKQAISLPVCGETRTHFGLRGRDGAHGD